MARPRLPIGAWGTIYTDELAPGRWEARAQFRDHDGVTRRVRRHGPTKNKATSALRSALVERGDQARGGEISGGTNLARLAELWLDEQERLAGQGSKSMTTVDQYRDHYRRHIAAGLGALQLRECTVSAVHRFLVKVAEVSPSTATMCRKVLSGMLGWAATQGAITRNPVRDAGRIQQAPKRAAQALVAEQVREWLRRVDADETARHWDVPDLSRFLLATGVRIGEALAVSWDEVDLTAGTVTIAWRMVWIKGAGAVRQPGTKSDRGRPGRAPVLGLPPWAIAFLKVRKLATGGRGPVFPHPTTGRYRDHREVGKAIRAARGDSAYSWLTSHSLGRKTVATILDEAGLTAREIADQLRHARPSMTQDVYMARGRANGRQAGVLGTAYGDVV